MKSNTKLCLFIMGFCFFFSLKNFTEYKETGAYTDYRNMVIIQGDQSLVTIYGLFFIGLIILIYLLLTFLSDFFRKNNKDGKKQVNQSGSDPD